MDNSQVVIHNSNFSSTPLTRSAVLDGFVVEDGYLDNSGLTGGAGMRNNNSSPTVRNCTFRSHVSVVTGSSVKIGGGAILVAGQSNPSIISCIFHDNVAQSGAAIAFTNPGTFAHAVTSEISNSLFYNNTVTESGGAVYVNNYLVFVLNNTFVDNTSAGGSVPVGGAITFVKFYVGNYDPVISNNIFWGNTAPTQPHINVSFSSSAGWTPTFGPNIFEGGFSAPFVIDSDPLFRDRANHDFTFEHCSPAVNQGDNDHILPSVSTDLAQNPRIFGDHVDLGAYENQITPLSFSIVEVENVSCNGGSNGQISVNASGGTGSSLEYSLGGGAFSSNSLFENLIGDSYMVTIKDTGNDCTYSETFSVTEPDVISITGLNAVDITCNGVEDGKIGISVTGGTTPYQVSFDGGSSFASPQFANTIEITDLIADSYQVTVVDGNACTITYPNNVVIVEPDQILASPVMTPVTCHGVANGSFEANASGGTSPLYYTIEGLSSNYLTSPIFENLDAGIYTLTVIDSKLCNKEFQVEVEEPLAELELSVTGNSPATCEGQSDGEIDVFASGGTAPYAYSVNGISFQATATFNDLAADVYTIIVEDNNDCQASASTTVNNQLTVVASISSSDPTCMGAANGEVEVSASGGVSPYSYAIDGINFQSSAIFSDLSADNYVIHAMDAEGCFGSVSITLADPLALVGDVTSSDVRCFGGSDGEITVSASGGTSPYEYSLDGINFQSDAIFSNLPPDSYSVMIVDASDCDLSLSGLIEEPVVLSISIVSTGANDFTSSAAGGTSPYEFAVDNSDFQPSGNFQDLEVGPHIFSVKDAHGCITESDEFTVVLGIDDSISGISTYPNPVAEYLTIKGLTQAHFLIYDMQGQQVLEDSGLDRINLQSLQTGIFLINVYDHHGEMVYSGRLIKE